MSSKNVLVKYLTRRFVYVLMKIGKSNERGKLTGEKEIDYGTYKGTN